MVSKAFNYTVTNEYYRMKSRGTEEWRIQVMSSKFVLCPSGFSFDSYRIWETLMMGSIPIVESNPSGLDRIFSTLPVLIVRSFSVLTPEYLEKAYPCFITHAAKYNFHLLQASYWRSLVNETMTTGTRKKINENHPFYHRHCNYLSP